MNNLNSIFSSILPENLKNTPAIKEYIDIFIEILEENSKVSLDSINFFNDNISNYTEEELIKIYLYDYYSMMKRLKSDYFIVNRFRQENKLLRPYLYENDSYDAIISNSTVVDYFNIGGSVINSSFSGPEFDNILAAEINVNPIYSKLDNLQNALLRVKPDNFYFNRLFKETKGFVSSIRFIYDCLNKYLVPDDERLSLEIKETGEPFKLLVKGSIDREIYRSAVEYLTHPLGFVYSYDQVRQIKFDDYFSVKYIYKNSKVEVRCLQGNSEQYNKNIKEVVKFNGTLKVIFEDLTLLTQENGEIKYFNSAGLLIKKYSAIDHCAIYVSYDLVYTPTIYDTAKFLMTSTFSYDQILITDKLNHTIKYTPVIGLVIGRFFLGVGERFNQDNNVYSFNTTDEIGFKKARHIKNIDNILIKDLSNFKMFENLGYDEIILDEQSDIKSTLIYKDQNTYDDYSKTYYNVNFDSDDYEKPQEQIFKVKFSFDEMDEETILDLVNVNGINDLNEEFNYSENLKDKTKFTLKDSFDISEKLIKRIKFINSDNFSLNDSFIYSDMMKFNEIYNSELLNDKITSVSKNSFNDNFKLPNYDIGMRIITSFEESFYSDIITDEFSISSLNIFTDKVKTKDVFLYDFNLDDTVIINDNFKIHKFITSNNITVQDGVIIDDNLISSDSLRFRFGSIIDETQNTIGDGSLIYDSDIFENYKIEESNLFNQSLVFKIGEVIGESNIGEDSLISDTDINEYYKYIDNMDIF